MNASRSRRSPASPKMPPPKMPPRRKLSLRVAGTAAALALLSGCATGPAAGPAASTSGAASAPAETAVEGYPAASPRGLAVGTGGTGATEVLLATAEGVFSVLEAPVLRRGPAIDVSGFAVGAAGSLLASGTPGPGTGLPSPLGLARSTDGGRTWQVVARGGESDFTALAATGNGAVAYDGTLRTSPDLAEWSEVDAGFVPLHLTGLAGSGTVLAATAEGPQRSTDGGRTWSAVRNAPLFVRMAFANAATAVAVTGDGSVFVSEDGGIGWTQTGEVAAGNPGALAAAVDGGLEIWVAVDGALRYSADAGASFRTVAGG